MEYLNLLPASDRGFISFSQELLDNPYHQTGATPLAPNRLHPVTTAPGFTNDAEAMAATGRPLTGRTQACSQTAGVSQGPRPGTSTSSGHPSRAGHPQQSAARAAQAAPGDQPPAHREVAEFCQHQGLSHETFQALVVEGFTSRDLLALLDSDAITTLPIPLAQKLVLKNAVGANNAAIPPATPPAVPPAPTAVPEDLQLRSLQDLLGQPPAQPAAHPPPPGASLLDPRTFLTNKMAGEKFYDIVDFVPGVLTREEKVTLPGSDSEVTLNIGARKPKLESVTLQQWSAANAKILYQLAQDGKITMAPLPDYLAYTVKVSQLAEHYEWVSVLAYDQEYRRLQASLGFAFGTDAQHLHTVYLVQKQTSKPGNRPSKARPTNLAGSTKAPVDPASGKEVCRNYNKAQCKWGTLCYRAHVCLTCFAAGHAQAEHPKNP